MLHNLGGCDAKEEWAKGYDAAIDDAISHLDDIPVIESELMKRSEGEEQLKWIDDPSQALAVFFSDSSI